LAGGGGGQDGADIRDGDGDGGRRRHHGRLEPRHAPTQHEARRQGELVWLGLCCAAADEGRECASSPFSLRRGVGSFSVQE